LNGLIGRTISHYTILEQVGQGGMSSVFSAADLANSRLVAMKILAPYIAHEERFQARFEREIKLLSRLQHPNIIPILDFGEADGLAFIVMPYIASGTLLDRLNRGPLDPRQGGRIVDQMASALMLAHQNGVIHRDVKPSNVLVDEKGNALLSDFSFARSQDASQNLTGSALIGTPAYMSPEGCRGNVVDARSDQYSFGVMLFQITTGALPFTGGTPMATALQHINVPLPRPRAVNPNLPEEIELVLIRALAKDPALRFDSMEALNRSFQAALAVALDPQARAAADGKTISSQRTLAMYRKYQNIKPPERQGRLPRSAILAALLLLAACTVSAGAIAVIRPDIFTGASAQGIQLSEADLQATIDSRLATALAAGTSMPTGALETEIYATVFAAVEATRIAAGGPSSTPSPTSSAAPTLGGGGFIPTSTFPPTKTLRPGETPPTSTNIPLPSPTPTPSAIGAITATGGATSTLASTPTGTTVPTNTPGPSATSTPAPPTATPPPTSTRTQQTPPQTPPGQLTQAAKTAAAETASASTPTP
jgi:serine/threonine protein kinase